MAKKCASGGKTPAEGTIGNRNVVEEAKERKKGGKIPPRLDKRRATGGRVGSDSSPLSSAHKASG